MNKGNHYLKMLALIVAAGFIGLLVSCNDDDPDPDPDVTVSLEAVIDYSPSAPEEGEEVTLDASLSVDDAGVGFDVQWTITSAPENSTATIADPSATTTTFTPDIEGSYEIELEISNATEGVSDTETQTITVLPKGFEELSGAITTDLTLENIIEDPTQIDYLVTGNVTASAMLTIEPGVVIHFQENTMLTIDQAGSIKAEGTESDSIIFTSVNEGGGILWKGIFIGSGSSQNIIKYAKVMYAGNEAMNFTGDDFKAGIGVNSGGNIRVENSTLMFNDGYGLYVDENEGHINTFINNDVSDNIVGVGTWADEVDDLDNTTTFSNNSQAAVEIMASSFSETNEATWNVLADGASYNISGTINVNGTLTIAPGANFEMDEDVIINVYGAFIANGTDVSPINFTTSDDALGLLWKGIYVNSADGRNILNHVNISYAGNSIMNFSGADFSAGLGIDASGKISITNSTFSNNEGYGVYSEESGGQIATFEANTFSSNDVGVGVSANEADALDGATIFSNNQSAAVEIFGTTYEDSRTSTWKALNGSAAYRVTGNVDIDGALTIEPGVTMEFDEDVLVRVYGSLTAEGTASEHITFTTSNLNGGLYWKGIHIISSTTLNSFDYVDLSYAGQSAMNFSGADFAAGIGVDANGRVSVTNSSITECKNYGLYIEETGGQLEIFANNDFSNNLRGVGLRADEVDALDGNTTFSNNSFAEVEIFGSSLSDIKDVTWTALSGDAYYRVTGRLDINGVLTIAPGALFEFDEDVDVRVYGAFIADGTVDDIITFTSSNITGGLLWKGFHIISSDSRNSFDFTLVSHGGNSPINFSGDDFAANIGVDTNGQVSITNSTISNSGAYGVYSKGTTNNFTDISAGNTFTSNPNGNF
ncbi:MAG: hypothetical protein KI791_08500 [Cyclobacteriaceae bacterium]|nr:hypothetical protein [Cyclobacteriaceae bacterium SS2]